MTDRVEQQQAAIDDFLDLLQHERRGDTWVGRTPDWYGPVVFGGVGLALTISAACGDAPAGSRLHSLHAHFLRPVQGGQEIVFRSEVVKAGRTFNLHQRHRVAGRQAGHHDDLLVHHRHRRLRVRPVRDPRRRAPARGPPRTRRHRGRGRAVGRRAGSGPARCDPTAPARRRTATGSACPDALDDDPHLHTALLGYATDWTGIGGRPLHLEGDTTGMISLDHAAWFHRPARADDWLLQDVQSLVNAGGRGTLRGVIRNPQGLIVASMAQEMLLRPVTP